MFEKVVEILNEYSEIESEDISINTSLATDLGLSSLDLINIVVAFEDEFDIEVPDNVIKRLQTVADVITYLEQYA